MEQSKEKMVNLIIKKCLEPDYRQNIGFSGNIFMIFGLPTQRVKGNPVYWTKKTSFCELTIMRNERFEIPYGCYARMNQIFIDTEVRTKNTNVIDVGRSFREYTNKLGYKDGKANRALVKQLVNYVTSVITVIPSQKMQNRLIGFQSVVARKWDISFDVQCPDQLMLSRGQIILDPGYARWVHEHSAPLDMDVVSVFKRNPLALDFYRYLAYRNNDLPKTVSIPDCFLFEQLGTGQQANRVTRERLKKILKTIHLYWPVKAKFEDGFFELKPSPPAVQKKPPSITKIRIIDKFGD
ncbi:hypothetical protein KKB40_01120 [Patescibacteria group bacterium]|nr:hypothetical protein [Patescibacteria group bacterium]